MYALTSGWGGVTITGGLGTLRRCAGAARLGVNLPTRVSPRSGLAAIADGAGVYRRQQP